VAVRLREARGRCHVFRRKQIVRSYELNLKSRHEQSSLRWPAPKGSRNSVVGGLECFRAKGITIYAQYLRREKLVTIKKATKAPTEATVETRAKRHC
jgi:hypothetical protein